MLFNKKILFRILFFLLLLFTFAFFNNSSAQELLYGNAGFGLDLDLRAPIEFLNMNFMNISNKHIGLGFIGGYAYFSLNINEKFEAAYSYVPISVTWLLHSKEYNLYSKFEDSMVKRYAIAYFSAIGSLWGRADFTDEQKKKNKFLDIYGALNAPIAGDFSVEFRLGHVFSNIAEFNGFYLRAYLNIGFVEALE